jgi:hypothetical protein
MSIFQFIYIFILAVIIILATPISLYHLDARACAKKTKSFNDSYYGFSEGCMVQTKSGEWIPLSNYRYMEE